MQTIPKKLLGSSRKVAKGEKKGYQTHILYLLPHTQNSKGINLCPYASEGCAKACLAHSGSFRYTNVHKGVVNKTNYYIEDRQGFLAQLRKELTTINKRTNGFKQVVRLNGTSDVPWHKAIKFGDYPNIQFYDYTKNPKVMNQWLSGKIPNYHLTFSLNESNYLQCLDILDNGGNVAAVFDVRKPEQLPKTYKGFKVINGDETDLRFLDDDNVIVGLTYKQSSKKGANNAKIKENNDFVIKDF